MDVFFSHGSLERPGNTAPFFMQKKLIIFFALLNDVLKFRNWCGYMQHGQWLQVSHLEAGFFRGAGGQPQICRSWRRFESEMNCQPQCQCDQEKNKYWIWGTIDQKSVFAFCKPRISHEYRNLSIPTAQTMRIFKVLLSVEIPKALGGVQNPSAKICAKSKWESHLPQFSGWKFPKYLRKQRQSLLFPGTLWDGTSFGETWKESCGRWKNGDLLEENISATPRHYIFCKAFREGQLYFFEIFWNEKRAGLWSTYGMIPTHKIRKPFGMYVSL